MKAAIRFLSQIVLVSISAISISLPQSRLFGQGTNCTPVPGGLVSWWAAEGNVTDRADGNNGALLGGATYGTGKVGLAFSVNGANQVAQISDAVNLDPTNAITVEGWVLLTGIPGNNAPSIVEKGGGFDSDRQYELGMASAGNLFFLKAQVFFSGGGTATLTGSTAMQTNTWYHLGMTYDGSSLKIYVNGNQDGSTNATGALNVSTHPLWIGGEPSGPFNFVGLIDEMSLYNRALTAPELQAIYASGSAGKCTGPAAPFILQQPTDQTVYVGGTAGFNVFASGTAPLSYQWLFNGTNLFGETNSTLTLLNVQTNQAGDYSVLVSNSVDSVLSSNAVLTVNEAPPCAPAPVGLVAWWPGEGNGDDWAGTNSGVLLNGVGFAIGEVRQGFNFSGVTDCVEIPHSSALISSNFSVEAWVKPLSQVSDGNSQDFIFGQGYGSQLVVRPGTTGIQVAWEIAANPSTYQGVSGTSEIPIGEFSHLVGTCDGATAKLYINGVLSVQTTLGITPADSGCPFFIGGVFSPAAGSCQYIGQFFNGIIDEVSFYSRALTAPEVANIYASGSGGKCPLPPFIAVQPDSQTVTKGNTAAFSVKASGTPRLNYQWTFNGTNIFEATNSTLTLPNVQTNQSGNYAVIVSNVADSIQSSNALLTVTLPPACALPPTNLVSLWRADGNTSDAVGGNNGVLAGNATFGPGRIGQSFIMDGSGDAVQLGKPAALELQNFTIEGWIRRANPTVASFGTHSQGFFFGYGTGGYGFGIGNSGQLFLTHVDVDNVTTAVSISDTNFHHVAVTKTNATITFYIDGIAYPAPNYSASFTFSTPAVIGAFGSSLDDSFWGNIDELSIYARALSTSEIQAIYNSTAGGKCAATVPPFIISQPPNRTANVGSSATFAVTAGGSIPFAYQWRFNGTNIVGETNASLTLNNIQVAQAGNYSVVVTNAGGSIPSNDGILTVVTPTSTLRLIGTNSPPASTVTVPVQLLANGNEYALSFSVSVSSVNLTFIGATLGSDAADCSLFINTNQITSGRLGVQIIKPWPHTFSQGTREVARVTFGVANIMNTTIATISSGDQPTVRQLLDAQGNTLALTFSSPVSVSVAPASSLEGDVAPRPSGNRALALDDWFLVGRFVARLDSTANSSEFQRADCAPRSTAGDGRTAVTDWVQAGRYEFGMDAINPAGGPTSGQNSGPGAGSSQSRRLSLSNTTLIQGQSGSVSVSLDAQGDENALGFGIAFDPTKLSFINAASGAGASGATLLINSSQAGSGQLGFALALPPGSTFGAGSKEIVKLNFNATSPVVESVPILFSDVPVLRETSDAAANALPTGYDDGAIATQPLQPVLQIAPAGTNVVLSWPVWAADFNLQKTLNLAPTNSWTNVVLTLGTNAGNVQATQAVSGDAQFFRLAHP